MVLCLRFFLKDEIPVIQRDSFCLSALDNQITHFRYSTTFLKRAGCFEITEKIIVQLS